MCITLHEAVVERFTECDLDAANKILPWTFSVVIPAVAQRRCGAPPRRDYNRLNHEIYVTAPSPGTLNEGRNDGTAVTATAARRGRIHSMAIAVCFSSSFSPSLKDEKRNERLMRALHCKSATDVKGEDARQGVGHVT